MSRTKYELRRARQSHRCTECGGGIAVKVDYLFAAMPPEHDMNDGRRWYMQKICPGCITRSSWVVPTRKSRDGKPL